MQRLNARTRGIILQAYDDKLASSGNDASEALRTAMSLFVASAEFHSTTINSLSETPRQLSSSSPSLGRPYKAVIVLYLNGGVDSYNLLVPHSGCGSGSNTVDAQYTTTRAHHAISKSQLLQISAGGGGGGTQPCTKFGLHPQLTSLKAAYDAGDAAFIANIGTLVEPITKADFRCKKPPCKQLPPALFAHNTQVRVSPPPHTPPWCLLQPTPPHRLLVWPGLCGSPPAQTTRAQNVHAQNSNAKGIIGRLVDALTSQSSPYRARKYSLNGLAKILEGATVPDVLGRDGVDTLEAHAELGSYLTQMGEVHSHSLFAETFVQVRVVILEC